MAWKHENVFLAGDAYAPKHWLKSCVHYANTYGSHKVLLGTDWPVIAPERAVREVDALGFRSESKRSLMRDNALAVLSILRKRVALSR
jgi:predicted TIM-barrel fold metal-dependent hydrolase